MHTDACMHRGNIPGTKWNNITVQLGVKPMLLNCPNVGYTSFWVLKTASYKHDFIPHQFCCRVIHMLFGKRTKSHRTKTIEVELLKFSNSRTLFSINMNQFVRFVIIPSYFGFSYPQAIGPYFPNFP